MLSAAFIVIATVIQCSFRETGKFLKFQNHFFCLWCVCFKIAGLVVFLRVMNVVKTYIGRLADF